MRSVILVVALSLPLPAFGAGVMNVKASEHSCSELTQIIRQNKRSLFASVSAAAVSVIHLPSAAWVISAPRLVCAMRGKQCILDYSCVFDPASPYNFP